MSCHLPVRTRLISLLMAELLSSAGAVHVPISEAAESQVEVKQLLKTTHSWDGVRYRMYPDGQPELSLLRYKIPPHSALPWHTHPVINVAYVLSGHLTVIRKSDGKAMVIGPGDVLPEIVDAPHRGRSAEEPVELIVFYAGTPSVALTLKSEPN